MGMRQRRPETTGSGPLPRTAPDVETATDIGRRPTARHLRKPRSSQLIDAVTRFEGGLDEESCRQLAEWIAEEYTSRFDGAIPLGLLAYCDLGPGYVDHRLNLVLSIIECYRASDRVPDPFAAARPLVRSGAYACVEVYSDGLLVPVRRDGTVSVL